MSYKNPDRFIFEEDGDPDKFLEDLISRKEFAMYATPERIVPTPVNMARRYLKSKKTDLNELIKSGNYLFLHSYQKFIENLMNPLTDFSRILVGWQAGAGKTLPPLKVGINLLDSQMYAAPENMGNVIILGFTQSTFKKELLKYPELGFLSREEYAKYQEMSHRAFEGSNVDREAMRDFLLQIKRRMTSRATHRARFVFMGYKQFAHKLFMKNPKYQSLYLGDIERSDITSSDPTRRNAATTELLEKFSIHELNEDQMRLAIEEGKVIVNQELLAQFRNSFLVCDEIHKVYNSEEQNHWGVAISYVLNYPGINLKVMFLSATPMNNHHTEIVDLLNMLLPPPHNKVRKSDLFIEPNYSELRPGALELIGRLTAGRVSFLQDQDPRYYPSQDWVGEKIPGIDILRFVRCHMTPFHYNTYEQVYNGTLAQESQYLVDLCLPNPSDSNLGMYQTTQIISELERAPETWRAKYGLYLSGGILTGSIMERANIRKYSAKYDTLLGIVESIIKSCGGEKTFIYHDTVHISGVLFIQELLKYNGLIDESSPSTPETLCLKCGRPKRVHHDIMIEETHSTVETEEVHLTNLVQVMDDIVGGRSSHKFVPVRFMIAHSDMDKSVLVRNMEKYNSPENMHGDYILFIIGSQLMRESHDMKHLRHEIVVNLAGGVPALVQIFGRGVRNFSHKGAPPDEWNVKRYILVTSLPHGVRGYSYEEERYLKKVRIYQIIQKIEKVMHEYAIDAALNYAKISRVIESSDSLSILPYRPKVPIKHVTETATYRVLYAEQEVNTIVSIIKRIFIEWNPVWTFDDLWNFISDPASPIASDVNFQVQLLSKDYFAVALTRLIKPQIIPAEQKSDILDRTFDPSDRILSAGGDFVIEHVGRFYVLVPLIARTPLIDVESPFRHSDVTHTTRRIALDDIMVSTMDEEFDMFIAEHSGSSFEELHDIICLYTLEFHEFILRKIIPWLNRKLTGQKVAALRRPAYTLYVRLLYQYQAVGVIVWASADGLSPEHTKWIKPPCTLSTRKKCAKTYIPNIECTWCPAGILSQYLHNIGETLKAIEHGDHVTANMLPVGYMLRVGYLYGRDDWIEYQPTIVSARENDIVIGYDERLEGEIVVKFKIRNPRHKIEHHKDIRRIEKGTACSSKNKEFLTDLAKSINADFSDTNIHALCTSIRNRLLYLESIERQKPAEKRLRYFYHVHELHN